MFDQINIWCENLRTKEDNNLCLLWKIALLSGTIVHFHTSCTQYNDVVRTLIHQSCIIGFHESKTF